MFLNIADDKSKMHVSVMELILTSMLESGKCEDWIRCFTYPIQCNITWKNARKSEVFVHPFFLSTPYILHKYFTWNAFIYGETLLGVFN